MYAMYGVRLCRLVVHSGMEGGGGVVVLYHSRTVATLCRGTYVDDVELTRLSMQSFCNICLPSSQGRVR